MNPSYVRVQQPLSTAMPRFVEWIGLSELEPARKVKAGEIVDTACGHDGSWRGVSVFAHEADGWSVFDDLSGDLAAVSAARWAELAGGEELVFAGYNDAVPYGQLIAVRGGKVVREFLNDEQEPRQNVNRGRVPCEADAPIDDWVAAASFVDDDPHADAGAGEGFLLLFQRATR